MVRIDADTPTQSGTVRLSVRGQLDLEAASLFREALSRAGMLRRPVALDLSEVDFIDGSGLNLLIDAHSHARCMGRELAIVSASRRVLRLIAVTGTADRLPPLCEGVRRSGAPSGEETPLPASRRVGGSAFIA
jgi:anti-sigma B factor antagonist